MQTMAAVICSEPGKLVAAQMPVPGFVDGEVLLQVRRVGICGTDYHIFEGKHPFLRYPRVMGHELAAEVIAAPAGSGFSTGEHVAINPYRSCGTCVACRAGKPNCCVRVSVLGVHEDGGMREFISLPAKQIVKSRGLSLDGCAAVEFLAIGAHAVRRAGSLEGARALIVGAGPIGLGAALFARLAGAEITLVDRDAERLALVASIVGAHATIVATEGVADEIMAATSGDGFEVVLDATGNPRSMEAAFGFAGHGGRYVLVGVVTDRLSFSDAEFHKRELTLFASRNALNSDFDTVIKALLEGRVDLGRVITNRSSLAGIITDLPNWTTAKAGLIKAVVELD
jgi:2-desacetyl-2-hydroxyethyl bacteriochlorophyllide A dehydrogenase